MGWGRRGSSSSPSASSSAAADAVERGGDGRCSTRKVVSSTCKTEEVDGRFIRKCDKTEQLLRDCVGRPAEVVESRTEHTEEDVTDQVTDYSASSGFAGGEDIFSFPGLRSDIDVIQRSMQDSLGHFLRMAEEMTDEFFGSVAVPSRRSHDPSPPIPSRQVPMEGSVNRGDHGDDSGYADLPGQLRDV
ncbi:hypothetical protein Taro_037504 [Colocasia esculenta]|uniref:Uncharacterized protein n=1 Tax=Colocasia esculenta TaxID=4460 RepID=A0A843W9Y9_COLES|nr:hypothetical protein [Colocasia esculenta]